MSDIHENVPIHHTERLYDNNEAILSENVNVAFLEYIESEVKEFFTSIDTENLINKIFENKKKIPRRVTLDYINNILFTNLQNDYMRHTILDLLEYFQTLIDDMHFLKHEKLIDFSDEVKIQHLKNDKQKQSNNNISVRVDNENFNITNFYYSPNNFALEPVTPKDNLDNNFSSKKSRKSVNFFEKMNQKTKDTEKNILLNLNNKIKNYYDVKLKKNLNLYENYYQLINNRIFFTHYQTNTVSTDMVSDLDINKVPRTKTIDVSFFLCFVLIFSNTSDLKKAMLLFDMLKNKLNLIENDDKDKVDVIIKNNNDVTLENVHVSYFKDMDNYMKNQIYKSLKLSKLEYNKEYIFYYFNEKKDSKTGFIHPGYFTLNLDEYFKKYLNNQKNESILYPIKNQYMHIFLRNFIIVHLYLSDFIFTDLIYKKKTPVKIYNIRKDLYTITEKKDIPHDPSAQSMNLNNKNSHVLNNNLNVICNEVPVFDFELVDKIKNILAPLTEDCIILKKLLFFSAETNGILDDFSSFICYNSIFSKITDEGVEKKDFLDLWKIDNSSNFNEINYHPSDLKNLEDNIFKINFGRNKDSTIKNLNIFSGDSLRKNLINYLKNNKKCLLFFNQLPNFFCYYDNLRKGLPKKLKLVDRESIVELNAVGDYINYKKIFSQKRIYKKYYKKKSIFQGLSSKNDYDKISIYMKNKIIDDFEAKAKKISEEKFHNKKLSENILKVHTSLLSVNTAGDQINERKSVSDLAAIVYKRLNKKQNESIQENSEEDINYGSSMTFNNEEEISKKEKAISSKKVSISICQENSQEKISEIYNKKNDNNLNPSFIKKNNADPSSSINKFNILESDSKTNQNLLSENNLNKSKIINDKVITAGGEYSLPDGKSNNLINNSVLYKNEDELNKNQLNTNNNLSYSKLSELRPDDFKIINQTSTNKKLNNNINNKSDSHANSLSGSKYYINNNQIKTIKNLQVNNNDDSITEQKGFNIISPYQQGNKSEKDKNETYNKIFRLDTDPKVDSKLATERNILEINSEKFYNNGLNRDTDNPEHIRIPDIDEVSIIPKDLNMSNDGDENSILFEPNNEDNNIFLNQSNYTGYPNLISKKKSLIEKNFDLDSKKSLNLDLISKKSLHIDNRINIIKPIVKNYVEKNLILENYKKFFKKYYHSYESFPQSESIEKCKFELVKLNEKVKFDSIKFDPRDEKDGGLEEIKYLLFNFDSDKILDIELRGEFDESVLNVYFKIIMDYNLYLVNNNILSEKIIILDTEFFKNLQECLNEVDFEDVYRKYHQYFFDRDGMFILETRNNENVKSSIIIPILLQLDQQKILFLARFGNDKKMTLYDSTDRILSDENIKQNYTVIFENFFEFLHSKNLIAENYCKWNIEIDSSITCYDENSEIIVVLYCLELISKNEIVQLPEVSDIDKWKNNIFIRLGKFYIILFNELKENLNI